ncbi:hypothetical protein KQX54_006362 [Cotesia glomerata]|uniref:Uncharacterized protein n=1 Tax=Cotesia glomerata TaxID=32391 RepID=A0AAV7J235_COTGL|nr:hypothetical protein KQX54_006362 [Cotesia glomerata]
MEKINSSDETFIKGFFTITDGTFKMGVTVNEYKDDHDYERGDHLLLTGSILHLKNEEFSFVVDGMADIQIKDQEKKTLSWLLQGNKRIILQNSHKKPRYD